MHEPFLDPMPTVIAHRGDSANYPENTLPAFLSAQAMHIDVIETDVHLSGDGELVIWHDPTLERNTNGSGRIEDHTLEQLKAYDAGYMFTKDGGKTFPFRGKGVQLCTLDEALKACPNQRFNVDLKTKDLAIVEVFLSVIRQNNAENRVLGASFHLSNLKKLRKLEPKVLTSLTTQEVLTYLVLQKLHLLPKCIGKKRRIVFQVPVSQGAITVITDSFVRQMHERNAVIQVWTINKREEMERLFKMGVDSIMTDKPALVIEVAETMGLRKKQGENNGTI
jgi:glycerophosphoryl diester phosphodiesterase